MQKLLKANKKDTRKIYWDLVLGFFMLIIHRIKYTKIQVHWPVFPGIRTRSQILSLYGRIRVSKSFYSRLFYTVYLWSSSSICRTNLENIDAWKKDKKDNISTFRMCLSMFACIWWLVTKKMMQNSLKRE